MTTEHRSAVGATWAGIRDLFVRRREIGPLSPDERLDGRTLLVTGGTTGLGRAVAGQLAERGARVVVTGRQARGLPEIGHDAAVTFAPVDLTALSSIAGLADRFEAEGYRFDGVVQNAAMVAQRGRLTADGFDEMEQVNFTAGVALMSALWSSGLIVSEHGRPRLVVVGSEAHRSAEMGPVTSIGQARTYGAGRAVAEYGRSKLLLLAWAMALARRMSDRLDVFALCPGAVNSELAREAPTWSKPLLAIVFALMFQSPKQAAEPVVYLSCARAEAGNSGTYLHLLRRKRPAASALDEGLGDEVWARVYALLALHGFRPPA